MPQGTSVGNYEVRDLIGRGANASVYRLRHRQLGAEYALKILDIADAAIAERLLLEGQVQASLRHPNVVTVTDAVTIQERPALVLEFVDGPDLERFIEENAPLPLDEIDTIAEGILKGVRAAHRAGHLHRDLKPANILLTRTDDEWTPKVADFGLAKVLHYQDPETSMTRRGQVMGSPTFMSPEQCRDASSVDERSDVFSLGAVLYELATGHRCFEAPDLVSVFARISSGAFVPVHERRPQLPRRMILAIHGALLVEPYERIPDCDTLLSVWRGERLWDIPATDVTLSALKLLGQAGPAPSRVPEHGDTIDTREPTPEPAPSPRRRRASPAVWGSFAFFGAVAFLGLGMLMAAVLLFGVMIGGWTTASSVDVEPAEVLAPLEDPEPVEDPPEPGTPGGPGEAAAPAPDVPEDDGVAAPVAPGAGAQPAPAPSAARPPEPVDPRGRAPAVVVEPRVTPVPRPAAGATTGGFDVQGDARVRLVGGPGAFTPGQPVPAGPYWVEATWAGQDKPVVIPGMSVEVKPGRTMVIRCTSATATCQLLGMR